MKTLGEINIGDTFYLIYYKEDYIYSVKKYSCTIINEILCGKIIKWFDDTNYLMGVTIKKESYNLLEDSICYSTFICADKNRVIELLQENKDKFLKINNQCLKML